MVTHLQFETILFMVETFQKFQKWTWTLLDSLKIHRMMKHEPLSRRADNTLAGRCHSFAARWARVFKRPSFYPAAYINNNGYVLFKLLPFGIFFTNCTLFASCSHFCSQRPIDCFNTWVVFLGIIVCCQVSSHSFVMQCFVWFELI